MKVTSTADVLMTLLSIGGSMTDPKVDAAWSHVVFISADLGKLNMSSARADAQVKWSTDQVAIHEQGYCAVYPKPLMSMLKSFGREVVTLELSPNKTELSVHSGGSTLTMQTIMSVGRPMQMPSTDLLLTLDGDEALDAFEMAKVCAHNTAGDTFNVILIQRYTDAKGISMVGVYGTDRSVMHAVKLTNVTEYAATIDATWAIPMDMLQGISNAIIGDAVVQLFESKICVVSKDGALMANLVQAVFPVFMTTPFMKASMDNQGARSIVVERKVLVDTLNRAEFVEADLLRTKLAVDHTNKTLTLTSTSEHGKSLTAVLELENSDGSWHYHVAAGLLRNILKTLRTPQARITWRGPLAPLAIADVVQRDPDDWQITLQMGLKVPAV